MNRERAVWIFVVLYSLSVAAMFVLPRFAARNQFGLAAAGVGGVTVLLLFTLATLCALITLVLSLRGRKEIGRPAYWAGLFPAFLTLLSIIAFGLLLPEKEAASPAPTPLPQKIEAVDPNASR